MGLKVVCILDPSNNIRDDIVEEVMDHCKANSIIFTMREYDSVKYKKDRNSIEKLPAFYIYRNSLHLRTVYTESDVVTEMVALKEEYESSSPTIKDTIVSWIGIGLKRVASRLRLRHLSV